MNHTVYYFSLPTRFDQYKLETTKQKLEIAKKLVLILKQYIQCSTVTNKNLFQSLMILNLANFPTEGEAREQLEEFRYIPVTEN